MPLAHMTQVNTAMTREDRAWLEDEAARRGVARSEVVRRAIAFYRQHAPVDEPTPAPVQQAIRKPKPPAPTPTTATTETTEASTTEDPEMPRPKTSAAAKEWNQTPVAPKKRRGRYTEENPLPLSERVQPPKTQCERCGATVWADESGQPKSHLRAATPSDPDYDERVPVRVECAGSDA